MKKAPCNHWTEGSGDPLPVWILWRKEKSLQETNPDFLVIQSLA
jgi:hypothetical protein